MKSTGRIRIRPASADDAAGIAGCVTLAYQDYIARLGKPPAPMLADYDEVAARDEVHVAVADGEIIGVLVIKAGRDGFLIENVAVRPDHQGHGLGARLMTLAEDRARSGNFDEIVLYTHEKMVENQRLYRRLGYRPVARRREHGYDRIYMGKSLDGPDAATIPSGDRLTP